MSNPKQQVIINTLRTFYSEAFQPEGAAVDNDFYQEIRMLENQIRALDNPSDKEIELLASQWRRAVHPSILRRLERDQNGLREIERQFEKQVNLSPIPTTHVKSTKSWAQIKEERNLQQTESIPTTHIKTTKSWAQMKEERRLQEEQAQSSSGFLPTDTQGWRDRQQQQRVQQYTSASFQTSPEIAEDIAHTYEQYLSTKGNDGLHSWLKPVVKEDVGGTLHIQTRFFSIEDHNNFIAELVNQQRGKNVDMVVRGHDNEIIATVTNGDVDMDEQLGSTASVKMSPS